MAVAPVPGSKAASSGFAAFAYRDFKLHCAGRFLSTLALNIQSVAIGWYVYSVTGSALALGFAGLSSFLPSIILAPFTGHVADTRDRKSIVAAAFAVCACASVGLITLALLHVGAVLAIYACILVVGGARAFAVPAAQALTPNLVAPGELGNAITWYSSWWQGATVVGPALGGLLYLLGPITAFMAAFSFYAAAAVCTARIRSVRRAGGVRERITLGTLTAGLRFIRSQQVVFGAMTLDLVAVLFGGATALMPIVADRILHAGPVALGLLRTSPALGAICMGAAMARRPIRSGAGKKMLAAVAVYGFAVIGFGLSSNLILSMGLLAILGASDQISIVVRHTMVQAETPDEMRGRVAAVNAIFTGATNDVGEFESGLTAYWFGLVPAILLGGIVTLASAGLWAALFPRLRRRNKLVE